MYSIDGLERGIEDIKKNIKIFEETIEKERQRINEYYDMIEILKQKQIEADIKEKLEKEVFVDGNSG